MAKGKETEFEKLARLIKEESEDTRDFLLKHVMDVKSGISGEINSLEARLIRRMDEGFSIGTRRLDESIQPQLDDHAKRLKKPEGAVLL